MYFPCTTLRRAWPGLVSCREKRLFFPHLKVKKWSMKQVQNEPDSGLLLIDHIQECIKCLSTYIAHKIPPVKSSYNDTLKIVFLTTKLEVKWKYTIGIKGIQIFYTSYICSGSVLLVVILSCVFCLFNWNMMTIISYCSPVKWRALSSKLILVAFIFCLSHYHQILHTAIFWIYMLQYFMWLQVFVLLWINIFFLFSACSKWIALCACICEVYCCHWRSVK